MSDILRRHLERLSTTDQCAKDLFSQWNIDACILSEALSHISKLFTHFSRHDSSHAEKILTNIEMFLGADAIEELTATDIWLLLESAYWHDIGMVVRHDEFTKLHCEDQFKRYLHDITLDKSHEMSEVAQAILEQNEQYFCPTDSFPIKIDNYNQLLAGYYRSKHAERSAQTVNQPEKWGIKSPRTDMIAKRLFGILGKICESHTMNFSELLALLHRSENGHGSELCHPRFVACLLRMGDLLDLDNGRFSSTLGAIAAPNPTSQSAHVDKHEAINHFLVTPTLIEIEATNTSYQGYVETAKWFGMLTDEIKNFTQDWLDIVPDQWKKIPPRIGRLHCGLGEHQEVLANGAVPLVAIDSKSALEIFQGAGIYENRWQAIRELLQNAVDASLISLWIDHKDEITSQPDLYYPDSEEFKKKLSQYIVNISATKINDDGEYGYWKVSIKDNGVGISKEDFEKMLKVASGKNTLKKEIISSMPKWLRPSGEFGLGLQSAFALGTERLDFFSKSRLTGESYHFSMPSPTGSDLGYCSIEKLQGSPYDKPGTTLVFTFKSRLKPSSIPGDKMFYDYFENVGVTSFLDYDSITDGEFPVDALKILRAAAEFRMESQNNIQIMFNDIKLEQSASKDTPKKYYDHDTGLLLKNIIFSENIGHQDVYYRGQLVERHAFSIPFVSFSVDIYGCAANEALAISRNKIKSEYRLTLFNNIIESLRKYIDENIDSIGSESIKYCSACCAVSDIKTCADIDKKWEDVHITDSTNLRNITKFNTINIIKNSSINFSGIIKNEDTENSTLSIEYEHSSFQLLLLVEHALIVNKFYYTLTKNTSKRRTVVYSRDFAEPLTEEMLKLSLIQKAQNNLMVQFSRVAIPPHSKFSKLAVKKLNRGIFIEEIVPDYIGKFMILPFLFLHSQNKVSIDRLDELCKFLADNSDISLPLHEIKSQYLSYIDWIDNTIMKDNKFWMQMRGLVGQPPHQSVTS